MDAPTLQINGHQLQNFISFIYTHERLLKEFGAIKIQLDVSCKLALKNRRKNIMSYPTMEQIVKISNYENIYFVQEVDHIDEPIQQNSLATDERNFWSSLSSSNNEQRLTNISILSNKSFFGQKTLPLHFNIHHLPRQSMLQIGGS